MGGEDAESDEHEEDKDQGQREDQATEKLENGQQVGVALDHALHLDPVWKKGDVEFTNVVNGFDGILDHIFIDSQALTVKSRMPSVPTSDVTTRYGGLPNEAYGSDHLAMACRVQWLPIQPVS